MEAMWDGASGFELVLAPSSEDQTRYAIESVREIDRHAARATLRTFGLASAVPSPFSEPLPALRKRDGVGDRIVVVRLVSRQTLRMLEAIRGRHPNVGRLYVDLEGRGLVCSPGRREDRDALLRGGRRSPERGRRRGTAARGGWRGPRRGQRGLLDHAQNADRVPRDQRAGSFKLPAGTGSRASLRGSGRLCP